MLNKKFLKFYNYLMEGFKIDLKTFLGLAMPNLLIPFNCQKLNYQTGFGGPKFPNLHDPNIQYYSTV